MAVLPSVNAEGPGRGLSAFELGWHGAARVRVDSKPGYPDRIELRDADIVPGTAVEGLIERLLEDSRTAYVHAHYAKPGCYAARIERA